MSSTLGRTGAFVLASVLAAGCGRWDLNAGRVDPDPPDVPLPMTLEVIVVDDRGFVGDGAPVEGAEVRLDDASGPRGGITDHDGKLVLASVPTDGSASLTVWKEGFPALTILGLGAGGLAVPSPLRIGLGTLGYCWVCSSSDDRVTGEIHGRVDPSGTSPVAVSLPGGRSVSTGPEYVAPLGASLAPTQRLVGLELDETEDGAHILSFAEEVWDGGPEGPPLELRPGDTAAATIEIQSELDPDGALWGSAVDLAVVDEVTGGIPSALLGLSTRPHVPGSTLVEYALLDGDGEPTALLDTFRFDTFAGARARAPLGDPLVLREPPHVVVEPGDSLDLANEPVELVGADWASARYLVLGTEEDIYWVVLPPPGATSVRLPPAPSDPSWPETVYVAAAAVRWNGEPWDKYLVVGPGWARSQLRELAFDASARGRLRPDPDPLPDPGFVSDCGGPDDLEVVVVDDVPFFVEGDTQSGIEVVIDCSVGRMRATTDAQGRATFHGLDFANDPPDVSALDPVRGGPGRPGVRTRVALGSDRPVPSPYEINLYRAWSHTAPPPALVTVERSAGTELYCSSTGSHPYPRDWVGFMDENRNFLEASTTFNARVYEELSPARVGCLEFDGTANGPRTVVAFGEALVDYDQESAVLALDGATQWERSSIRIDHRDATWTAERVLRAFVEDEGPGNLGLPFGMNEGSEIGADGIDTVGLAWAPAALEGTPWLRLEMHDVDDVEPTGVFGWQIDVPMDQIDQEWEAKAPPRITAEGEGADRVLRITGTEDWAQDYYVLAGRYEYFVPAGHPTIRFGRMPDDRTPVPDQAHVRAFRYDAPLPEQDHWDGVWWSLHVREAAWHSNTDLD